MDMAPLLLDDTFLCILVGVRKELHFQQLMMIQVLSELSIAKLVENVSDDSITENTVQVPSQKKSSPTTSVIVVSDDTECNNHRDLCENAKCLSE